MEFTEADIIALKRAIATGTQRVEYHDKVVWYRTLSDMMQTLKWMMNEVYGPQDVCRRRYAAVSKGTREC